MKQSELIHIISESIKRQLLNESSQDKAALRYLKSRGITDYNVQMQYIGSLKHDVPNLRLDNGKFVTAGLRFYLDNELRDSNSIRVFELVLNYIHKGNHASEYDFNLNGLSFEELSNKYKEDIKQDNEQDRQRSASVQRGGGNGYTIIPINSYEEASKYSEYTSWCVTHGENAFEDYTQYGNRFYFCLKNGFEQVQKNDEGAPLNEYGLSMIAVNIDMEGNLTRITTRYNHDYNGENNEGLCTVEQLEDVLDVNFYKTFLPYTREELHALGIILFDEVQEMLDNGADIEDIDKDYYISEGIACIELNDKFNFINVKNKKLLSPNQWFDYVYYFRNGLARVELNSKWNWIDTNGKRLNDEWYYYVWDFSNGYSKVELDGKYNFINTNGKILSNQWYDDVENFENGYACVKLGEKYNFINTNGKRINDEWYDNVEDFENGYANVKLGSKWYYIDTNGQLYDFKTEQPITLNE